jgi:translation initiation factor IF-3
MEHINIGMEVVRRAIKDLSGVGRPDDEPKLSGRFIMVNLSPLPSTQRILKYNTAEEAEVEDPEEEEEEDSISEEQSVVSEEPSESS